MNITHVLRVLTVLSVGLLAGSLSLEGLVLVPYWRSLRSGAFADLHAGFAPRLYRFFAPLTTAAVVSAVASGVVAAWKTNHVLADWLCVATAILAGSLLAIYGLYFHAANDRLPLFAAAGDDPSLEAELRRWQRTHQMRTLVCFAAFVLSILGATG